MGLGSIVRRSDLRPVSFSPSTSPNFSLRPSTSVLLKIEPLLNPQSYCSLDPSRLHSLFD